MSEDLDSHSVADHCSVLFALLVLEPGEVGESPLVGDHDLLSAGEFVLGSSESLQSLLDVGLSDSDRVQDGADLDSGGLAHWLSEGSSHSCLESIGTSARQHLIDSQHVPGVHSALHVEVVLAHELGEVLVGGDSGSFKSFGGNLVSLLGDDVDHVGEEVDVGLLSADVVDPDLGVGHSSVVPGLGVGFASAEPVAPGWSSSH